MNVENEPTLSFIAEWFDCHPQVTKKYLLKYYPASNEVEMKETSTRTKFLKRTKIMDNRSLTKDDFYIGATIILFSRDLKLVDYGDNDTRRLLEAMLETSVLVITPAASSRVGYVVKMIEECGLTLVNMKSFRVDNDVLTETALVLGLDDPTAIKFDPIGSDDDNNNNVMDFCIAIEFRGRDCLQRLLATSSMVEQILCQSKEEERRLLVASSTIKEAEVFKNLFLSYKHQPTARYDKVQSHPTTCVVIKPHAIKSRHAGAIIDDILHHRQYNISAMQIFTLDRIRAAEFYEVYNTAIKEYNAMVDEMCSGPVLAMEICCEVNEFRKDAGPFDVEVAKILQPDTIRAKFGKDRIQNAIHCTDLPEESVNELSYFFDILCSYD